jgi:hypothetical protein
MKNVLIFLLIFSCVSIYSQKKIINIYNKNFLEANEVDIFIKYFVFKNKKIKDLTVNFYNEGNENTSYTKMKGKRLLKVNVLPINCATLLTNAREFEGKNAVYFYNNTWPNIDDIEENKFGSLKKIESISKNNLKILSDRLTEYVKGNNQSNYSHIFLSNIVWKSDLKTSLENDKLVKISKFKDGKDIKEQTTISFEPEDMTNNFTLKRLSSTTLEIKLNDELNVTKETQVKIKIQYSDKDECDFDTNVIIKIKPTNDQIFTNDLLMKTAPILFFPNCQEKEFADLKIEGKCLYENINNDAKQGEFYRVYSANGMSGLFTLFIKNATETISYSIEGKNSKTKVWELINQSESTNTIPHNNQLKSFEINVKTENKWDIFRVKVANFSNQTKSPFSDPVQISFSLCKPSGEDFDH